MSILWIILILLAVAIFVSLFGAIFWLAVLCDLGDIDYSQMDQGYEEGPAPKSPVREDE